MRVATKGETLFPLPHCQMQINVVELIFANAMAKQDVRQLETSKCVCGNTLLISASRSLKICATRVNTMFRNPIIQHCIVFENHFKMFHFSLLRAKQAMFVNLVSAMLSNAQQCSAMLSNPQECSAILKNTHQSSRILSNLQCSVMLSNPQ